MNEISLTVTGIKDEHLNWTIRVLYTMAQVLRLDGTDFEYFLSYQKNRDGIERIHEYLK